MYSLDSAESIFLERQLQYVKAKTYDKKYPSLRAREFIPTSNEVSNGAETVKYEQWDRVGKAQAIGKSGNDLPRVSVFVREFVRPVRPYGTSYGWNLFDIRSAMYAGKPLDSKLANAARRVCEEKLDDVACFGDADWGIPTGFLNDTNVDIDTNVDWGTLSGDEIITKIQDSWIDIREETKDIEKPNGIILPISRYGQINLPRGEGTDITVRKWLLENLEGLEFIESWYRLSGIGGGGADRVVMYRRDADHIEQDIPNEFEQLPLHQHGMNFDVQCIVATAGTKIYYPKSIRYLDVAQPAP